MEHAVIVRFDYGQDSLNPLLALEEQLQEAIGRAEAGEYDGHEVATDLSDGTLYLYGPNAEALFAAARPALEAAAFLRGATATLWFGPPVDGVPERTVTIGA